MITTDWEGDLLKRVNITAAVVLVTAVLSLWGAYASAGQTLYRWIDERGNQVNSDRPPPTGIEYEEISTSSSMVRQVDAEESVTPPKATTTPGTNTEPANQEATEKLVTLKNPEYCAIARENLKQLDTSARIRLRNEQGEIRYLNEEEKAVEREKALSGIESFCE